MATLFEGRVSGDGGSVQWKLSGPGYLRPGAFLPLIRQATARAAASTGAEFLSAARSAYQGTRFAATFRLDTSQAGPWAGVTLSNADPIFGYVEAPTRAHTIAARGGGYLVFPVQGHWVKVRSVAHPGTKGKRLIEPLFHEYQARFRASLIAAVKGVFGAL